MTNLYLHVGMPKTGTSYIQALINLNHQLIMDSLGLISLKNRTPHQLASLLIDNTNLINRSDIKGLRTENSIDSISDTISKLLQKEHHAFICSSEYFILPTKKTVVEFFSKFFSKITVIYSIRRQDMLIASGFNQDVKALDRTSNLTWNKDDNFLNYYQNYLEWKALGCDVSIISYDSVTSQEFGLEHAFSSILFNDDSLYKLNLVKPTKDQSNLSLKKQAVLLKLSMNRHKINNERLLVDFISQSYETDSIFKLPDAYARAMMTFYEPFNEKLFSECHCEGYYERFFEANEQANYANSFVWDPLSGVEELLSYLVNTSLA